MIRLFTTLRGRLRDERGMIAVWFLILSFTVIFGFTFYTVNLDNTHEHQRHLQVQVDDAALAAGPYFTGCFQSPSVANANIAREAHRFAGDPTYPANHDASDPSYPTAYDIAKYPGPFNFQYHEHSPFNPLIDVNFVGIRLNTAAFPSVPANRTPPLTVSPATDFDPTYDLRPDILGIQNMPCDSDTLDVKATDFGTPTPFGGLVPGAPSSVDVKARARVVIKKVKILSGFLPWAVPETRPQAVMVIFVDDNSGNVRGATTINDTNTTPTLNGEAQELWQGNAQFKGQGQSGTDVIVGLSSVANPDTTLPTLNALCTQSGVACYAGGTSTSGLWFVDGFTNGN